MKRELVSTVVASTLTFHVLRFAQVVTYFHPVVLEIGAKEVPAGLWGSVRIMAAAGCMKEARQLGMILDERHPDAPFSSIARGFILALDGATSEARSAITPEVEAWAGSMMEWAQFMGDYYAVLGDKDRALEWLELSLSLGFLNAPFLAQGNPFLQTLREDSRFTQEFSK